MVFHVAATNPIILLYIIETTEKIKETRYEKDGRKYRRK